jgi:hypothetical protein
MREFHRDHIVADGRRRVLTSPHHCAANDTLRRKMKRRLATVLARSSWLGKLVIHLRIHQHLQRRLRRLAPPAALYLRTSGVILSGYRSHDTRHLP